MADETKPEQKADAILCPHDYPKRLDTGARHVWRNKYFGPILGVKRVHFSHAEGGMSFGRADPMQAFRFPTDHLMAGQERYAWTEPDKNGIQYGTLIPEPNEPEEPEPNV